MLGTTDCVVYRAIRRSVGNDGVTIWVRRRMQDEGYVVVLGGAVMDVKASTVAPAVLGTSNPSTITTSPGGVGRNIAECLARLGRRTTLLAAVGDDAFGRELIDRTAAAGVDISGMLRSEHSTGTYLATLDHTGELVIGVSDMRATDSLTTGDFDRSASVVSQSAFVVIDGNIPADVVRWALQICHEHAVPVALDPVSVAKAARLAPVLGDAPIDTVTPNLAELAALIAAEVDDDVMAIADAASTLHAHGVRRVWVRRGRGGSVLSDEGSIEVIEAPRVPVVDVTGAGDAMAAAYVDTLLRGESALDAARYGHRAAAFTIAHPATVRPDLSPRLLASSLPTDATSSSVRN